MMRETRSSGRSMRTSRARLRAREAREPWREVRTRRVSAVSVLRAPARRSTVAVTRARRLALAQAARLMQRGAT
jgi:hypothetical protein